MFQLLLVLIYICFISLGLPDSLLGSAWPVLHGDIGVPLSYAGIISMVISVGTIVSSLLSDTMTKKLGTGRLTAISVLMSAVALFGFSVSSSYWMLLLWAIPYGLGAGGVDAVLNNYVALHYKAQHMSWLHCFWGVGASISPYIMSFALVKLESWNKGYLIVAVIQIVLALFMFLCLPLWKKSEEQDREEGLRTEPLKLREIFSIPGATACFLTFFAYCALELTASLWASSYLVQTHGVDPETASAFASMFYIGITLGRGLNGFFAMRFSDRFLVRVGLGMITVGVGLMFVPFSAAALTGFVIAGLGCAPIYPCVIHMTPGVFGKEKSQALIGFQMAFAYVGFCIMPPLFGFIAQYTSIALLPFYLLALLVLMTVMHEVMAIKTRGNTQV